MLPVILHHQGSSFTFHVPTGTEELSGEQAARLYELQHSKPEGEEYLAKLALILFNVRPLQLRGRSWLGALPGEQFEQLQPVLEPFLGNIRQEKQVLPGFSLRGWYYVGPASRLANITLIEFAVADFHFLRYFNNPNDDDLFALAACLYRPWRYGNLDKRGDARQVFNRYGNDNRTKAFKKHLPRRYAYYALEFFRSGRELITDRWKDLFSEENEGKVRQGGNGWLNLMYSMSGPQFGTFEETGQTRLSDVLLYCRQTKEENERIKNERNNH